MTNGGLTVLVANPSADLYGSDRMLLEAIRGLVQRGDQVVATCSTSGPLVPQLTALGVRVLIMPVPIVRKTILRPTMMVRLLGQILPMTMRMYRLIRRVNPDVVIANTVTIPHWTLVARLCRKPTIVYVHEAEASLPFIARRLLAAPLNLANRIIFNSEASRTINEARLVERANRTYILPNGVEGPISVSPPREKIDGLLRICFVGRLSPRKGADLLVDAVAHLQDEGIGSSLEIVGDVFSGYEWFEDQLRMQVRECELTDRIVFQGFQETVWDRIAAADVVVVPSRGDESFGNIVIESLLSARPVVVADHSGLRVATEGFSAVVRVEPNDSRALATGIRSIYADWSSYSDAATLDAERARELYSPAHFRERFAEIVDGVASARGS